MATKPNTYINWTDGAGTKVTAASAGQQLSGWVAQKPSFRIMNWINYVLDQWIQWFDFLMTGSNRQAAVTTATVAASPISYYFANPVSASFAITLPAASLNTGYEITVKHTGIGSANTVTVSPNGSDNIEGSNTGIVLNQGEILRLRSDGTGYWQV